MPYPRLLVPCPCISLLLICTSTGDTQTQFCLSLCGVSGSWCAQGLFEPSEHLWWVWGLILNVRSMNHGKLEVVRKETARVNINILGTSELKWTGMGEFNSDDHYIYHCGQESLRRNGVALIVNKRVWKVVLGCSLKNDRMICSFSGQTIQYHSNPSLCSKQ